MFRRRPTPNPPHPYRPPISVCTPGSRNVHLFTVVIFSLCDGTGIPLLALLIALDQLRQKNYVFNIVETHTYESSPLSRKLSQALRHAIDYPGPVYEHADIANFPVHAQRQQPADYVIVLGGTPCTAISKGARFANRTFNYGLHAPPSNLWWTAKQGIKTLYQQVGHRLFTFIENVIPANDIDLLELDNTAGHRHTMHATETEGAHRPRYVWTSVGFQQPSTTILLVLPEIRLTPPLQWTTDPRSSRRYPTLRSIIPSRLYALAADPTQIPLHERDQLQEFFVYNPCTGRRQLPPLQDIASFMSVPPYVIQAFKDTHPCKQTVIYMDHQDNVITEPCGDNVWCAHCSDVISALGAAWNTSTTSRHLLASLSTFVGFQLLGDQSILANETFNYNTEDHVCTKHCRFNRNRL